MQKYIALIPSPALPGAGSMGLISARNFRAPRNYAAKLIYFVVILIEEQQKNVIKCF